jgi:hypothetical protein
MLIPMQYTVYIALPTGDDAEKITDAAEEMRSPVSRSRSANTATQRVERRRTLLSRDRCGGAR